MEDIRQILSDQVTNEQRYQVLEPLMYILLKFYPKNTIAKKKDVLCSKIKVKKKQ